MKKLEERVSKNVIASPQYARRPFNLELKDIFDIKILFLSIFSRNYNLQFKAIPNNQGLYSQNFYQIFYYLPFLS